MEKILVLLLLLIFSSTFFLLPGFDKTIVQAEEDSLKESRLSASQPLHTESRFETKLETKTVAVPKDTTVKNDPEIEAGEEVVEEEGKDGKKTIVTSISFYEGKEYSREIVSQEVIPAIDKVVKKGTKIVWKNLITPQGEVRYWKKMRVYATHYDSRCPGCNETTATGLKAGKGVIAVDPSVIRLGSKIYIPEYGQAIAGDTGGAIKGNIIDLGFDDARTSGWRARFIDIYLQ
jgi:3D (Asp-Asp-Asp) domain-containing protein